MNNISEHITFAEATKSQEAIRKGIPNEPTKANLLAMQSLAEKVFEPLRKWHGKPIGISSFFRSEKVNKAIGGSTTSQHCANNGASAIDIDADIFNNGISNSEIFKYIKDNLPFDQLIWEFGNDKNPDWVHVSTFIDVTKNRKQILKAVRKNLAGKSVTIYEKF